MANSVMMYDVLGYPPDHPHRAIARASLDKLLVVKDDEAYCQPCVSPVWDTALVAMRCSRRAARGGRGGEPRARLAQAAAGARRRRATGPRERPDVRPGGWAFQYTNAHYPDLDDTAVVVMAMDRARGGAAPEFDDAIDRAREWIVGLQSQDGGWGAFDADNGYHYLNNIPFADHGALLDPPTADVTGALPLDAGAARRAAARQSEPMARGDRLSARATRSRREAGTAAGA